ncbi:MAG: hypothetical protein LH624_09210 [Cryobacterium sp.]|nr:hypothetical protein [Cryobacterium sp.]
MQPLLLAVCVPLWVAATLCVPSVFRGRRRLLFWTLVAVATTMTLQPRVIYNAVDEMLGGVNVTYFIFHATAIVAIGLLDGLVQEAVTVEGLSRKHKRWTVVVTGTIISVQALLFFGGDWHFQEQIHKAFPDRWDFAAYSSTTWVAMAILSVSVGLACMFDLRNQRREVTRVSLVLVAFGCLWVLVYAVVSLASVTGALLDPDFIFEGWSRVLYNIALATSPISLGLGLGLTALADGIRASRKTYRDRALLWRITPLWKRLLSNSPELSIERGISQPGLILVRQPGAHLYRRYVEVRDNLLLDPSQWLSPAELIMIDEVEDHVRAKPITSPPAATLAGSATLDRT